MAGADGSNLRKQEMREQVIMLRKVISRLISPTIFEKHGWRRILGATAFFVAFGVDPKKIKLSSEEVFHPMHVPARSENVITFLVSNQKAIS